MIQLIYLACDSNHSLTILHICSIVYTRNCSIIYNCPGAQRCVPIPGIATGKRPPHPAAELTGSSTCPAQCAKRTGEPDSVHFLDEEVRSVH